MVIGGAHRNTLRMTTDDGVLARKYVVENWQWAYGQKAALFVHYPPKLALDPARVTEDGRVGYRAALPTAEVWFLPETPFGEAWPFAREKGFANSTLAPVLVQACDLFLSELAGRQPIGVEAVGQGWASFRRFEDGGTFDLPDMQRAWELSLALLGGRPDTLHLDPKTPRHFVSKGIFYFGL